MLRNYAHQNSFCKNTNFSTVFPGRYLYFDKYFEKLFHSPKPLSVTIGLFDGRVTLSVIADERKILIKGEKELSDEVVRHLYQFRAARQYSVEVI